MQIISRSEAKSQNLKHYFTGKPCKHGHINYRFVGNGNCLDCSTVKNRKSKSYRRDWHKANMTRIKENKKIYQINNSDQIRKNKAEYHLKNACRISEKNKKYYDENKEHVIKRNRLYRKNNPIAHSIRDLLKRLCNDWKGGRSKSEIELGYTHSQFKSHMESLFTEGMSWDNHGEWHIDHIVPVKWWLDNDITDPSMINALINLQPLWAKDNLTKGCKI